MRIFAPKRENNRCPMTGETCVSQWCRESCVAARDREAKRAVGRKEFVLRYVCGGRSVDEAYDVWNAVMAKEDGA
jgi:hypothetical protein